MKWIAFAVTPILLVLLAACAGESSPPVTEIDGPALVMFYTDN